MRTPLLAIGAASVGLIALASTLTPTPSGACSFEHPCDQIFERQDLWLVEIVAVDGSDAELPFDPEGATLDFTGWGEFRGIQTSEGTVSLRRGEQ